MAVNEWDVVGEGPLEPQIIGRMKNGRPVVMNPDGSISTHLEMTVTDPDINEGRPTNIPTMYGGQKYSAEEAQDIARRSNDVDPDTGQPFQSYDTVDDAEVDYMLREHPQIDREASWIRQQYEENEDPWSVVDEQPLTDPNSLSGRVRRGLTTGQAIERAYLEELAPRSVEDGFTGNLGPALAQGSVQAIKGIGRGMEAAGRAFDSVMGPTRDFYGRVFRDNVAEEAQRRVQLSPEEREKAAKEWRKQSVLAEPAYADVPGAEPPPEVLDAALAKKREAWVEQQIGKARETIESSPTFGLLTGEAPAAAIKAGGAEITKYAEDVLKRNPQWERAPELVSRPWTELIADPRTRGAWFARAIGENTPNLAVGMAAGVAGGAAAGMAGANAAAFGTTYLLESGFSYDELLKVAGSPEDAAMTAQAVGVVNAVLETLPISNLMRQVPALKKAFGEAVVGEFATKPMLRRIAIEGAKQAGLEGSTEALQEVVSNIGKAVYDQNQELLSGVGEAAFIGALMGGGMGAGGQALSRTQPALPGAPPGAPPADTMVPPEVAP
ncbi:MAG: hypothetical protein K2Y51_25940, partial [Gammaproteobacteria bacterium]|nr:hypothetical protein [Gammaproteobacteria bacterium]